MATRTDYKTCLANLGLFYSAAVWGSTFFIVKRSLASIDPVILVGYRFTLAALVLGGFLILRKKPLFAHFRKGILLGLFLWLLYVPQTIGLGITTASNSGFITGMFVAFVPIFSFVIFHRAPPLTGIISALVSLSGLWFLTRGLQTVNCGDLLTIVAAMAYAIHILFTDRIVKNGVDPYILSFQQFLFVGFASLIVGFIFKLPFAPASTDVVWVIFFLALFPTLSAFVIQLVAQKSTSPIRVSLIFAFEPVFAGLFAWTLGGEPFAPHRAVGGLLVFLALVISGLSSRKLLVGRVLHGVKHGEKRDKDFRFS
ncbi:MAG: DMT family transporter [Candidatus Zixiibacteriota bacterium]|nr:MAG: DMT family transporter [candidate division Zixibacteria bacterium]